MILARFAMRRATRAALGVPLCAAAALLSGCGDSGPTGAPRLASLTIALSAASIPVSRIAAATAAGFDQYGDSIPTGDVSWKSSAPNVASIDATGRITALAVGSATISGSVGAVSGSRTIAVTAAPALTTFAIELDGDRMPPGTSTFTGVTARDQYGAPIAPGPVTWSSSNLAVARVQGFGEVVTIAPGTAIITAVAGGRSAQDTITVTPYAITLDLVGEVPESPALGDELSLVIQLSRANGDPVRDAGTTQVLARPDDGGELRFGAVLDGTGKATFTRVYRGAAGRRGFIFTFPTARPLTVVMNFRPGRAEVMHVVAGNEQSARAQTAVPVPPKVRVTDVDNNPVAGAPVLFSVRVGNGRVTGASVVTDAKGEASVGSWQLGDVGSNVLTAIVTTTGAEAEIVATALAAEPAPRGARGNH